MGEIKTKLCTEGATYDQSAEDKDISIPLNSETLINKSR